MKTRRQLLSLAALALGAAPVTAAPITVDEPSFEGAKAIGGWVNLAGDTVSPEPGSSTASVPSPWIKTGSGFGSGWTIASQYSGGIPDGDIYAYANGGTDIRQTLAATLQADTTYTLTVAVGWRADLPGFGFPTFPGYGVELWAGGVLLASDYDTGHGGTGAATPAGDEWKDAVITYTSPSSVTADPLEIRLIGYGIQTNYDHVRLTSEPGTGGVPNIVDVAVDGSGNVILTLDGPAAGLTVEGSGDLTVGSFLDISSAVPSGNTFTIPVADVDPNGDGKDFFRVRN